MATQDVRLTATNPEDSSVVPVACNAKGELKLEEPLVVEGPPGEQGEPGPPGQDGQDGDPFSGNFAGDVTFGGSTTFAGNNRTAGTSFISKTTNGYRHNLISTGYFINNDANNVSTVALNADGSATFAGNKAGFTTDGNLWCTTRRGDTVILDFTSNGMGTWAPYTPPTRRDELKNAWAEKNVLRPKPEDSSQDEPETKQ